MVFSLGILAKIPKQGESHLPLYYTLMTKIWGREFFSGCTHPRITIFLYKTGVFIKQFHRRIEKDISRCHWQESLQWRDTVSSFPFCSSLCKSKLKWLCDYRISLLFGRKVRKSKKNEFFFEKSLQLLFPLVILFCVHCNYLKPLLHFLHSILSFSYSLLLLSYLLDLKQYCFGSQSVFLFQQSLFSSHSAL